MPDLLSIDEAVVLLNLAKPTVYNLVSSGKIPVMKKSKRLYFSCNELLNWLKSGRKKTIDEIEEEAKSYVANRPGSTKIWTGDVNSVCGYGDSYLDNDFMV